ncbi:hypothetical protein ACSBR1_011957 [Camellia fascicularis]
MVSAVLGALRDGLKLNSVQPIQTKILESILVASFTITTLLLIIPCEFINGSPVPTLIFAGLPSTFQAFVVCLVFAFAGSLSALLINDSSFLVMFCYNHVKIEGKPFYYCDKRWDLSPYKPCLAVELFGCGIQFSP